MYDNPRHIKDHRINARFDDDEIEAITHVAGLTGYQKSTLVRLATLKLIRELQTQFDKDLNDLEAAS